MSLRVDAVPLSEHYADLEDVRLHYVTAGSGPLVVLLHGFPEFWFSWRHQIRALAAAGFRVVAPDMRGYNLSDKPRGVRQYALPRLARDVSELISHLGESRAAVAGHDWGGVVAWMVGMQHPERVSALVIVNAPHPLHFRRAILGGRQALRSLYAAIFQVPWLPERIIRARDFALLRRVLRNGPARAETFSEEEIDRYVEAAAQPGALTATLNYYRAAFRDLLGGLPWPRRVVTAPVLVVWGDRDPWLLPELAEPGRRAAREIRVERLEDAGHWPHLEDPSRVNAALLDFLRAPRP